MRSSVRLEYNARQWSLVPGLFQPTKPTIGADMRMTKLLLIASGEILADSF
jgi:hypothetical protein